MGDTAITPSLDTARDEEFRPTARERLGIVVFLLAAVTATATWIGLLVWGALELVKQF